MSLADERYPGHGILQQIDLFILHWKALTVICPHVSVHFPVDSSRVAQEKVLCSASATFVLASDLSSGCSQVVPSIYNDSRRDGISVLGWDRAGVTRALLRGIFLDLSRDEVLGTVSFILISVMSHAEST